MTFFYDLNKKLDSIRAKPELTHAQLNERDMSRAAKGYEKYGKEGMQALAKAGREGKALDPVRKKHDKYDEAVEEGAYQGSPDKSQIPAVQRPNNPMTMGDLEKERTQSPTSAEGMRALQDKLSKIHPMDEVGDTPAGLAAVQKVGQRADRALGDAGTGYSGSELANPDKTYAARDRANAIAGRERIRANDKNPTRVFGGPNHGNRMEEGDMEEGNAFSGAVAKAKANGIQSGEKIKVGGKTYPVKESLGGMEQILQQHASDVAKFKQTGELSDNLYGVLFDYYSDNGEMPYGTQKARTGDPYEWITKHLDQELSMSEGVATEAAKWRDPKYKDKLYTQEPRDYDQYDYGDDDYYNPKPADYPGEKNLKGGGEFSHNDPLQKGQGIGRSGIKNSILDRGPRKGLPSRDQITSLKGSIKSAKGTHAEPNLPEAGAPMTAKQKSFAKLAPPTDKITFADKIAGAKQEVDEMLGDVAAEAMKGAIGKMGANSRQAQTTMKHVNASNASPKVKAAIGKASADIEPGAQGYRSRAAALKAAGIKGAPGEVDEEDDNNPFTSWKKPRADRPKVGSVERGALHDIEHTATGRKVTRRVDPNTGHSVGADDDTPASGEKRGRGRPAGKGAGKSIGAKGPSGTSKLMKREGEHDVEDQGEYDQEGDMAKDDIKTIVRHAQALSKVLGDNDNLPEWVQSKLAKIESMMISIDEYMQNQAGDDEEEPIAEKATSKKQQKFMGMVHAAQKGAKPASKEVGKVAKTMKKGDAEDFAATKHKGLPEKAKSKKKEVDETTVSGAVATGGGVAKDSGAPKATKSGGSMQYGKGVYESAIAESFNKKLNNLLNEGMSISMNVGEDGKQSLTVNATDEDAVQLAQLLKMAGLGGSGESCSSCGQSPCGCDHIDEELANSPSPEYSDTDTMVNTLSGGLNGRKSTGQTTAPIVNRDPRRGSLGAVAESNEKRLWELYNRYDRS